MTFITKRIAPTSFGLHVRYFVPNDPCDVNRHSDILWKDVTAIIGSRIQYDEAGPAFRSLQIFHGDGSSEDFVDAPNVDGWSALVEAMQSNLRSITNNWLERLTAFEIHPLWKRDHKHFRHLLVYQRDNNLPGLLTAECEICGSSYNLVV